MPRRIYPYPLITAQAVIFLLFQTYTQAVDAQDRGRLHDGRAFRKDPSGNTMVDYIAELEVEADSLRRQLKSYEEEQAERQARGESANCPPQPVKEKSLVSTCPPCPEKPSAETAPPYPDLRAELASVKEEKAKADAKLVQLEKSLDGKNADSQQAAAVLTKLSLAQTELTEAHHQIDALKQRIAKLETANDEIATSKEQLVKLQAKLEASHEDSAVTEPSHVFKVPAPAPRAVHTADPLEGMKNGLFIEINSLSTAVAQRDSMFRSYMQKPSAVKFSPAQPISSRGIRVQEFKGKVTEAQSVRELSLLKKEVAEIKSKIDFDIGMMSRLSSMQ